MSEPLEGEVVEETENLPAVRASEAIMARGEISVDEVVAQKEKIAQVMARVMTSDVHYGVIPGTQKPTLLKPGAEAILVALRLAPHYESEKIIDGQHLTVFVKCALHHIPTGLVIATGEGMCTTHESRYASRNAKRTCPECGNATIIKGKAEYGGGWVCWKKEGKSDGCGAKFVDGDSRIEDQVEGKIDNPDLPDQWNTVLKMADKRALIAAVLNGTAASDVFTQDMEDAAGGSASGAESAGVEASTGPAGRAAFPVPNTWAAVQKGVRACDNEGEAWALFEAFVRAASYHQFGKADSNDLTQAQRKTMLQKAAGAVVWLQENVEFEGPFVFFDESSMRQAWAAVLDGTMLEIPDYVPPEPPDAEADLDLERQREAGE